MPATLADLHRAWRRARKGKQPSAGQLAFDVRWLDRLLALQDRLNAGDWQPSRTVSFIVDRPKTREIHAPAFEDRIVHHWLIERLEPLFEPVFIHDSFANRKGKGTHAAVERLQSFMRSRNGHGYYLQLDIHNCFNTIHRGHLYERLCRRLDRSQRGGALDADAALGMRSLCHKLLHRPMPDLTLQPSRVCLIPAHKLLRNAKPGCGIAVGNLTSQFFANVYLDELDQFIKHELKVRHYVRYVDDFVLLGDSPAQLEAWMEKLSHFLDDRLGQRLRDGHVLQAICQGVDFLGYRVFKNRLGVRPRVLAHCEEALARWSKRHVRLRTDGATARWWIRADSQKMAELRASLSSYWGHFSHAQVGPWANRWVQRHPWLARVLFAATERGCLPTLACRWVVGGFGWSSQVDWVRDAYPECIAFIQRGCHWQVVAAGRSKNARVAWGLPDHMERLRASGTDYVRVVQNGRLKHGLRRREVVEWFIATARPSRWTAWSPSKPCSV